MKRSIALLLAVVWLAGCNKNQTPPGNDPFIFGRQTVPPPGTGAVAGRAGDPSYRGGAAVASAAPGPLAPPAVSLPPPSIGSSTRDIAASSAGRAAAPASSGWTVPAAPAAAAAPAAVRAETTMTPRGTAVSAAATRTLGTYPGAPKPPASSLAASTPSVIRIPEPATAGGTSGGSASGRTTFTRTITGSRPAAAVPAAPAGYRPMPATPPGKPIDIMTLPRVPDSGPAANERSSAGDSGIRFATDTREAAQPDRIVVAGGATVADGDSAEAADR